MAARKLERHGPADAVRPACGQTDRIPSSGTEQATEAMPLHHSQRDQVRLGSMRHALVVARLGSTEIEHVAELQEPIGLAL
jgi:hypothetical protein